MSPAEALSVLDQISRIAPVNYDAQVQRCKAVDVLRSLIEVPQVTLTPEEPEPDGGPVAD